jgi:hypothetical protein
MVPCIYSETTQLRGQILAATFIANGHRYTQRSINSVQLLHYKSLPLSGLQNSDDNAMRRLHHQLHAELVLYPNEAGSRLESDQDMSRLTVNSTSYLIL